MKYLNKYYQFINEATLNDSKIGIDYELSRPGREKLSKIDVSFSKNIKLKNVDDLGSNKVIIIRPTTLKIVNDFQSYKNDLGKEDSDFLFYKSTSRKYPWFVATKGTRTKMIRQLTKRGASKRGSHFRESAFLITLAKVAWTLKGAKFRVYTNRGEVSMDYYKSGAIISTKERLRFREDYDDFMNSNEKVALSMIEQATELVKWLGDSIHRIDYVVKNYADLPINRIAQSFLNEELQVTQGLSKYHVSPNIYGEMDVFESERPSEYFDYYDDIPDRSTLSKWNPSDMWIIFKGNITAENIMKGDIDRINNKEIYDLESLNNYLGDSIYNKTGIIGISLKQTTKYNLERSFENIEKYKHLYIVNLYENIFEHTFKDIKLNKGKLTIQIEYTWHLMEHEEFKDKKEITKGIGNIDIRTFTTNPKAGISLEIKGSKKSEHMSGKAGAIIKAIVDKNSYEIINGIKNSTSKSEIKEIIKGYEFYDYGSYINGVSIKDGEIEEEFYELLEGDDKLKHIENSRLQSLIVVNNLLKLSNEDRSKIISKIVNFGKSQSEWSAPHLLVK